MFKAPLSHVVAFLNNQNLIKSIVEGDVLLTPRAKYLMSKILEITEKSRQDWEKQRIAKVNEYGTLNEDGAYQILADNEHMQKFQEEMNELLATEVEFNVSKINASSIDVDMKDQFLINWMLED